MSDDPYRRVAGFYDRVFEPMNHGLRVLGSRMYQPARDSSILDVGCGTGAHLDLYRKFGCQLYGIDNSDSMLAIARKRLGEGANLRRVEASDLPFEDNFFDLAFCMLVLHEMEDNLRSAVLKEMKRVVKQNGRILLIDFHAGAPKPVRGWLFKLVILMSEIAAGRRHFRNYRQYVSIGGLPSLIQRTGFEIEQRRVVGGGTMALYLLAAR